MKVALGVYLLNYDLIFFVSIERFWSCAIYLSYLFITQIYNELNVAFLNRSSLDKKHPIQVTRMIIDTFINWTVCDFYLENTGCLINTNLLGHVIDMVIDVYWFYFCLKNEWIIIIIFMLFSGFCERSHNDLRKATHV